MDNKQLRSLTIIFFFILLLAILGICLIIFYNYKDKVIVSFSKKKIFFLLKKVKVVLMFRLKTMLKSLQSSRPQFHYLVKLIKTRMVQVYLNQNLRLTEQLP